jgi:hypothetical protein
VVNQCPNFLKPELFSSLLPSLTVLEVRSSPEKVHDSTSVFSYSMHLNFSFGAVNFFCIPLNYLIAVAWCAHHSVSKQTESGRDASVFQCSWSSDIEGNESFLNL